MRSKGNFGPSPMELKLRADNDRLRRELIKLKRAGLASSPPSVPGAEAATAADEAGVAEAATPQSLSKHSEAPRVQSVPAPMPAETAGGPLELLRRQVADLTAAKQRLSRLYFSQLEENRKRAQKLHQILENIGDINSNDTQFDLDLLLGRIAQTIRTSLGFQVVLIRVREPGTDRLKARAFAGVDDQARTTLETEDVLVERFLSWLKDEFKVSRSYFISHNHAFNRFLPRGFSAVQGSREEWEWHADDVLLTPLFSRSGDLVAYFSVDDPLDRLAPSREVVELLEIFGHHAVVAMENARLYRELERHSQELEAAGQHLHEIHTLKSNFVSAVSHELRTPLTAIRAYVDSLLSAPEGEITHERFRHFLEIINDESQRLARLIESVLDLSRFDSGTMQLTRQPVDMGELLEETARLLEPVAQVGQVHLKVVEDCADTRVEANRDQMRQLALHLGSNAVKFTPPGGTVTLSLKGDSREVRLLVQDTGIGIPEDSLEKIFERFYQVDSSLVRRYGGTGIGLAICKSIVEWHGGRIQAESSPDRGSCFTVTMPRRLTPRVLLRPGPKPQAAAEDVLRLSIEMVAEVMNARVVSLLAPDPDGQLTIRAAIGLDESVVRGVSIKPGAGVAGWVAENRRPVCVSGVEAAGEVPGSGRTLYQSHTFLSVPLEGERGLLGVLNVTDPISEQPFGAEDCHLLLHLAERVAAGWDRALGMMESQAGVEDTAQALRQVLKHLERARRIAPDRMRLARAVAKEMGLSEAQAGVISFASSIHDVGMRRLGEHLLDGGGTLSSEEREAVQRHPELGAELLRPLEMVGEVRDIVLTHHEWWDGSGYPRGLAGEGIPIGGRVLAVVDAYESMTVGRAHRPAISREDALAELQRLKGRQFDPEVVEGFERALVDVEQHLAADASPARAA